MKYMVYALVVNGIDYDTYTSLDEAMKAYDNLEENSWVNSSYVTTRTIEERRITE